MKKTPLLNSTISEMIAKMGHNDTIAIGDCGLPIPDCTKRIDLALVKGIPTFEDTLKAVLLEQQVEEVIVAKETKEVSPHVFEIIKNEVGDVKITFISHEELKEELKNCKGVIRTGEQTSYANVILKSGVVF
ncbi:D-ribose pyranase [Clostridium brassicae]|uniref:D-ribose pyranase n=1 Tax=Clostridium brassicae TaxID=2999072 RepID=A0ABT4DA18_9CLOT|nr:D-ribose pyranase [Clostridium brassicae]MCY6959158.1 D-ribose pyranase [Clostridium brassicae]